METAGRSLCPIPAASVLRVAPREPRGVRVEPSVLTQAFDSNMVDVEKAGEYKFKSSMVYIASFR